MGGVRYTRSWRSTPAAVTMVGGLTVVSDTAFTALTTGPASVGPTTLFSSTTAGTSTVTVPSGVPCVTIAVVGGTGGTYPGAGAGGEGAVVTSTVPVAPGETFTVTVGADAQGMSGGSGAGTGGGGATGGGGGSAVFDGSTPLFVAGGGGGSGYLAVGNADQGHAASPDGWAGTLTGPGAGGSGYPPGDPGHGMDGGAGKGGGGGGYFGGGGGGTQPDSSVGGGGGGGSSYPTAATQWDTTATPSVTITGSILSISTTSLPPATPGAPYAPVTLQAANLTTSISPYTTTLKWHKVALPKGLRLSSAGVLSGIPNKKLVAGSSSVTVQVTETVTILNGNNGKKKVKAKATVQATIPLDHELSHLRFAMTPGSGRRSFVGRSRGMA
jgi:hypothetical protein